MVEFFIVENGFVGSQVDEVAREEEVSLISDQDEFKSAGRATLLGLGQFMRVVKKYGDSQETVMIRDFDGFTAQKSIVGNNLTKPVDITGGRICSYDQYDQLTSLQPWHRFIRNVSQTYEKIIFELNLNLNLYFGSSLNSYRHF